jgi:hypothetical protein
MRGSSGHDCGRCVRLDEVAAAVAPQWEEDRRWARLGHTPRGSDIVRSLGSGLHRPVDATAGSPSARTGIARGVGSASRLRSGLDSDGTTAGDGSPHGRQISEYLVTHLDALPQASGVPALTRDFSVEARVVVATGTQRISGELARGSSPQPEQLPWWPTSRSTRRTQSSRRSMTPVAASGRGWTWPTSRPSWRWLTPPSRSEAGSICGIGNALNLRHPTSRGR